MIKSTKFSVTFKSTGEALSGNFQPPIGTTAVVGPNGSGKTFGTIEVARWLLYGKAALRGAASDYDTLEGEGIFTIRGQGYGIARSPRKETVTDAEGTCLAIGAKEVNRKVIELMGYDLPVFDICNASTQKNVDLFTRMRPAERKRMIDQVAGLMADEAVEKACRDEAKSLKRDAETLASALRAPGDEPVKPAGYRPSREVRFDLVFARQLAQSIADTRAQIQFAVEPTPPVRADVTQVEIEIIERHEDARRAVELQRTSLTTIGTTSYTIDQLEAAAQRAVVRKQIDDRGPRAVVPLTEVHEELAAWAVLDAYKPSDEVECPECHTTFRPTGEPPRTPVWSRDYLRKQEQAHTRWPDELTLPDGPDLTPQQIRTAMAQLDAMKQLSELHTIDDKSQQLAQLRAVRAEHEAYARDKARYDQIVENNLAFTLRLDGLGTSPDVDALADAVMDAELYEAAVATYDKRLAAYTAGTLDIEHKLAMAKEYLRGSTELGEARAMVKALLAPRISAEATTLINDMTNGKLSSVTVDDDMEIWVGTQPAHTLSGAGITVANIALRVALGKVLIGSAFPVFLGDEIDADLDDERREATMQAVTNLRRHLSQVIVVTHRGLSEPDFVHDTR